jgi:hypothetical protein
MDERETKIRSALVTYFPMFIATLSLVTAIYNGYLNGKFVDIIQTNVGRTEYMRTCKEIIDAYFQVKVAAATISASAERTAAANTTTPERLAGANTVAKVAALGTYLANLRNETIRQRYTQLSQELDRIVGEAARTPPAGLPKLFEPADRLFADLNDDCVKSARSAPM